MFDADRPEDENPLKPAFFVFMLSKVKILLDDEHAVMHNARMMPKRIKTAFLLRVFL